MELVILIASGGGDTNLTTTACVMWIPRDKWDTSEDPFRDAEKGEEK
jgi:hypothetical protein